MLNPREQAVLQGIERKLQDSDPSLAHSLRTGSPPARRRSSLGLMWVLLGAMPMVAGLLALMSSHLVWASVGFVAAMATGWAYVMCVLGDRLEPRSLR
jgi:hypothetical protein